MTTRKNSEAPQLEAGEYYSFKHKVVSPRYFAELCEAVHAPLQNTEIRWGEVYRSKFIGVDKDGCYVFEGRRHCEYYTQGEQYSYVWYGPACGETFAIPAEDMGTARKVVKYVPVSPSTAAAIAAVNAVGYNFYNPFGLMDR